MPSISLLPSQIELEWNKERALLTFNPRPSISKQKPQGCALPFKPQPKVWEILIEDCLHLPWGQSRCLESDSSSIRGSVGDGTDYSHTALPKIHKFPREGENWMMDNPYFTGQPANYHRPKCSSLPLSHPGDWVQGHTTQVMMKGRQPCGSSQKASFPPLLPPKSFILSQEKPVAHSHF